MLGKSRTVQEGLHEDEAAASTRSEARALLNKLVSRTSKFASSLGISLDENDEAVVYEQIRLFTKPTSFTPPLKPPSPHPSFPASLSIPIIDSAKLPPLTTSTPSLPTRRTATMADGSSKLHHLRHHLSARSPTRGVSLPSPTCLERHSPPEAFEMPQRLDL
ncbi:MAG: hypothetical protein Q9190_007987, partial [Brigantiaea leucoxantha]